MASTKALKNKIKGIASVKQITEAMKNSASSALMKFRQKAKDNARYIKSIKDIAQELELRRNVEDPAIDKQACIIISHNKGLCGSYNANVVKMLDTYCVEADFKFIGKKAYDIVKFANPDIRAECIEFNSAPTLDIAKSVFELVHDYRCCDLIYTRCHSLIKQEVVLEPLNHPIYDVKSNIELVPSKIEFLNYFQSVYKTAVIWDALIESYLSFQSSKVVSMENASKNAKEIMDKAKMEYNKIRQYSITKELIEIISAKQVLLDE